MITKWKISNFKSISKETELDLNPLTIFAGANSSGKSTFIQSILLVAQTLSHKVGSKSVVLNGALTSLGQFNDLKSNGAESDQITLKCTCKPLFQEKEGEALRSRRSVYYRATSNQFEEITCEISFDGNPSSSERELFQIQPRLFATQLSCKYRDDENIDQSANFSIHHSENAIEGENIITNLVRSSCGYTIELDENSMSEVKDEFRSAKPVECIFNHFLPEKIIYVVDPIEEDAKDITFLLQNNMRRSAYFHRTRQKELLLSKEVIVILNNLIKEAVDDEKLYKDNTGQISLLESDTENLTLQIWYERMHNLPRDVSLKVKQVLQEEEDLFDLIHSAMKETVDPKSETYMIHSVRPPYFITESARYLDNFFTSSLKYLGPLRDAPKPLYPLAPAADPYDVGLRGEHTASILELHKSKQIKYIPSTNFKSSIIDRKVVTRTLETAVIDWLQYLSVASSVESRDLGKLGHELKVSLPNSNSTHDLTHVGVGVSQILPILVMCLLADTDSTLVFEQPELHLHPKVQTLLGDFFLSMALCNKQCIVETHSEYFIDRIRFRIAAASPEQELNNQAKVYFVEKPAQDSLFREVVINEYGAIADWPEGFFDQSQQEAENILRAATMKRKTKRGKSDV